MQIWANTALTADGWQSGVRVTVTDGLVSAIQPNALRDGQTVDILLPAPANLHSHAFQRAMAGLTESRGAKSTDSFWTWRQLMYSFLNSLTPDDVEAIAAFAQMEMLEAGFAHVGEFHYLHHQQDGRAYDNLAEMAERIAAAASQTGIGLTLLPSLYQQGGCNGAPLDVGQRRFGCDLDSFARLFDASIRAIEHLPEDCKTGVAPHSLRAVTPDGLAAVTALGKGRPIHLHLAEQKAEIESFTAVFGVGPGRWLLDHAPVDNRWCLIHCTQLPAIELAEYARRGAVAGLCPITEASLGDGIFGMPPFLQAEGSFGIGTDSNIRISLAEELRLLEYSQRLRDQQRVIVTAGKPSAGAGLFAGALDGGSKALCHGTGRIETGAPADLLALDATHPDLAGRSGDLILDSFVFCGDNRMVSHLWAGGRPIVHDGRHFAHDIITANYHTVMTRLVSTL